MPNAISLTFIRPTLQSTGKAHLPVAIVNACIARRVEQQIVVAIVISACHSDILVHNGNCLGSQVGTLQQSSNEQSSLMVAFAGY